MASIQASLNVALLANDGLHELRRDARGAKLLTRENVDALLKQPKEISPLIALDRADHLSSGGLSNLNSNMFQMLAGDYAHIGLGPRTREALDRTRLVSSIFDPMASEVKHIAYMDLFMQHDPDLARVVLPAASEQLQRLLPEYQAGLRELRLAGAASAGWKLAAGGAAIAGIITLAHRMAADS